MDQDIYFRIKEASKHVVLDSSSGGLAIKCLKCDTSVNLMDYKKEGESGLELWVLSGLSWGFCEQHFDCEDE